VGKESSHTHTHALHELSKLFSLLCLQGNFCICYTCLSTPCLHNSDWLLDWFFRRIYMRELLFLWRTLPCCFSPFATFLVHVVLIFRLYYSIYRGPSKTVRGSNFCYGWFLLLYFTPCLFVTKRGSNFYLDRECIFKPVKWFLSQIGQRGSLLVCDWPHSDWTKSLVCKDAFHWDSTIQKCFRWFCIVY